MIDRLFDKPSQVVATGNGAAAQTRPDLLPILQPNLYHDLQFSIATTDLPGPLVPVSNGVLVNVLRRIATYGDSDYVLSRTDVIARAKTLIYSPHSDYIGDRFLNLHLLRTYAQSRPHQTLVLRTGPDLLSLAPHLDMPNNVEIVAPEDTRHRTDPYSDDAMDAINVLNYYIYYNVLEEFGKLEGIWQDDVGENNGYELEGYYSLRMNGIDTTLAEANKTPIVLKPNEVPSQPTYDLVLAPGSRADKNMSAGALPRSLKSLHPHTWRDVFRYMREFGFDGRIAFVPGTIHPEYVSIVYEFGKKAGLTIENVATPTLADFMQLVLQGQRFVGMDSGPAHIAAATIAAAREHGREIDFRQVFNGKVQDLAKWRVMREGVNGKILVYKDRTGTRTNRQYNSYDPMEMQIDPKLIAAFIMA